MKSNYTPLRNKLRAALSSVKRGRGRLGERSIESLINEEWYLRVNPDVLASKMPAQYHFSRYGFREGRSPSPLFQNSWYLDSYPDAAQSNLSPIEHYFNEGHVRGYFPNPLFDTTWYRNNYMTAKEIFMNPLEHYVRIGSDKDFDPHPLFNSAWYRSHVSKITYSSDARGVTSRIRQSGSKNKDGATSFRTLLEHFFELGGKLNLSSTELFDPKFYLEMYPDIASAQYIPIIHYLRWGWREGRASSRDFDARFVSMQLGLNFGEKDVLTAYARLSADNRPKTNLSHIDRKRSTLQLRSNKSAPLTAVCVGVLVYNETKAQITRIIDSAKAALSYCENVSSKIVIFDNGGTIPREHIPDGVHFIESGKDSGFPVGHNAMMRYAFKEAQCDIYIGANPDGAFHTNCIKNLVEMNSSQNHQALIEALQFPDEHPKYYSPESLETSWISGACFLVPKKIWEKTGGFDENIYLYCEDVDLSWSARYHGFKTLICPRALFYHDVSSRGFDLWRHAHMLTSARYLAYKWGSDKFRTWAEGQLDELGIMKSIHELPALEHLPQIKNPNGIPDFEHYFHFSNARWGV